MFNRAILIGRLTADPELKQTQSGISVCSFSIAVDRRFSGRDSERKTDFINITSWRQQAEFVCRYFHKGDVIGVEGSIQTRNYEDKNGNKRTATEIVTDNVFFTGARSSNAGSGNGGSYSNNSYGDNSYTAPAPAQPAYTSGAASDFEEVESDNDLTFLSQRKLFHQSNKEV